MKIKYKTNIILGGISSLHLCISIIFFVIFIISGNEKYIFVSLSLLCFFPLYIRCLFPLKIDLFEPIILAYIAIWIGCTGRSFWVVFHGSPMFSYLNPGYNFSDFTLGAFVLSISCFLLSSGYVTGLCFFRERKANTKLEINKFKLKIISIISCLIGLFASFVYIKSTGVDISTMAGISNKRVVALEETFTAFAYLKQLASISNFAIILIVYSFVRKQIPTYSLVWWSLFLILFFVAIIVPFISSSRMDVILMLINIIILFYYLKDKKLPKKLLLMSVGLVVLTSVIMLSLRHQAQSTSFDSNKGNYSDVISTSLETVLGSGNFVDLSRIAVITNHVSREENYYYGATYFDWITFPIPRVIWNNKPNVSLGPEVRRDIYKLPTQNNGFPPTIFGEAVMNFGTFGMPIVAFLFGLFLAFVYRRLNLRSDIGIIIYSVIAWRMSMIGISLNFSQMMAQIIPDLIFVYLFIIFVRKKRNTCNA